MRPFFQGTFKLLTKLLPAWLKKSMDTWSHWRAERAVTMEYSSLLYIFSPLLISFAIPFLHFFWVFQQSWFKAITSQQRGLLSNDTKLLLTAILTAEGKMSPELPDKDKRFPVLVKRLYLSALEIPTEFWSMESGNILLKLHLCESVPKYTAFLCIIVS